VARNAIGATSEAGEVLMCAGCDYEVATVGRQIDRVMEAEKRRRARESDETSAQHTIGLANMMIDTYNEHSNKAQALANLAMGAALAITRLLAVQEIHGVNFE
jgi:hypothetical protein